MIGAGLPEHILSAHAFKARENVLKRVVECMTDMEPPGDVGRRDHDAEGFGARPSTRPEGAGIFPRAIKPLLDRLRCKCLFQHETTFSKRLRVPRTVKPF